MLRRMARLNLVLMIALLALGMILPVSQAAPTAAVADTAAGTVLFIQNVGQWPAEARFQALGSPLGVGTTWVTEDAIWIAVVDAPEPSSRLLLEAPGDGAQGNGVNLKLSFVGANPHPQLEPFDPSISTVSYFLGNDPGQWHPDVPAYGGVRYVDLYPGIDLVLCQADSFWRLEARPGADDGNQCVLGGSVHAGRHPDSQRALLWGKPVPHPAPGCRAESGGNDYRQHRGAGQAHRHHTPYSWLGSQFAQETAFLTS